MSSSYYDALDTIDEEEGEPIIIAGQNNKQAKKTKSSNFCCCCCTRKHVLRFMLNCAFVAVLGAILALTYNKCVMCVIVVAVLSALTMNCVPLTPIVFVLSICVLIMHAIDYQRASIRVEVPLQDVVYIPTWKDVQSYVHVDK